MSVRTRLRLSTLALALAGSQALAADVNIVFLVDESGSMDGEHRFLETFVPRLGSDLGALGGLTSSFALIGYGNSNIVPRTFSVGGSDFGNAAAFAAAAQNLVINGAIEDGYTAIKYALDTLTFDAGARVSFVLVTDEDRDIEDPLITYTSLLTELQARSIPLTAILNQFLGNGDNSQLAIATDGTDTFIADGTGGFSTSPGVTYSSAEGTTFEDYTELALDTRGCVADLNQLRLGGDTADSFAGAFLNCLAGVIASQNGGMSNIISGLPLARVTYVNRQIGIGVGYDYRNRLAVRRLAAAEGVAAPHLALNINHNGQRIAPGLLNTAATGGAASADSGFDTRRLSFFVGGQIQSGDLDATAQTAGLDFDTRTLTLGVDYLASDALLLGVGLGRVDTDTDLDGGLGGVDIAGYAFTLYGSYFLTGQTWRPRVDFTASVVNLDNDSTRINGGNTMTGETDSRQVTANLILGFERAVGDDLTFVPYAGLNYGRIAVDGFTESGVAPLTLGRNSERLLSGELGAQLRKVFHHPAGKWEIMGEAALLHEFDNDSTALSVTSGTTVFNSSLDQLDGNYARIGLGATHTFQNGVAVQFGATTLVSHQELDARTFDLRLRVPFD